MSETAIHSSHVVRSFGPVRAERCFLHGAGRDRLWLSRHERRRQDDHAPTAARPARSGEVAVRRGARVEAADGKIGHVDGFLTDPRTNRITHLMLREGHLWGARDITIPVKEIARIDDGAVLLKLDQAQVGALPSVRIRWRAV